MTIGVGSDPCPSLLLTLATCERHIAKAGVCWPATSDLAISHGSSCECPLASVLNSLCDASRLRSERKPSSNLRSTHASKSRRPHIRAAIDHQSHSASQKGGGAPACKLRSRYIRQFRGLLRWDKSIAQAPTPRKN